jgi:hypothetical protein
MRFIHHDLGRRRGGEFVEITLSGSAANVRLMESAEFESYRAEKQYRYHGGLVTKSPVRLQVPHAGDWFIAVDMQGLQGTVRSAVRILPGAGESREPVAGQEPAVTADNAPEFDVLICFATEDRSAFVLPLAHALMNNGLTVSFEDCGLNREHRLPSKLDAGLARCRFGVVILSRAFLALEWTAEELDDLAGRVASGEPLLLPVWHEIARQELTRYNQSLAENGVWSTGTQTIEEIAADIREAASSPSYELTKDLHGSRSDWRTPGFRASRWGLRC